ncbi:MAG: hypothetical protein WD696_05390 [Bryobacteraceae bacterium]
MTPVTDDVKTYTVDGIRRELEALGLIQAKLSWFTRTQGEPSAMAETYIGHEDLFRPSNLRLVEEALQAATDDEERTALRFLRNAIAVTAIDRATAEYDDREENAELEAKLHLDWIPGPVPFKEAAPLSLNEPDSDRRAKIAAAVAVVVREKLNPILLDKERKQRQLAREYGFSNYVALSEEIRRVRLAPLLGQAAGFMERNDPVYRDLLRDQSEKHLNIPLERLRRSDLSRLFALKSFDRFFPKELLIPAFREFLDGMGIPFASVHGKPIFVDSEDRPLKEFRAACYPIRVPDDVRMTIKPAGGVQDFETMFHEGGHTIHFASVRSPRFEYQQLGDYTTTEAYAICFGDMFAEPEYIEHFEKLVRDYNRLHPDRAAPLMTPAEKRELIRNRAAASMMFVRRYVYAKLAYESALHEGDPSIHEPVIGRVEPTTEALEELYGRVMSRAYGVPMTDADTARFLSDVDPFFYSADYSRAFILAAQMHESFRKRFGPRWFLTREAGAQLLDYFSEGTRMSGDELARRLGYDGIDIRVFEEWTARCLQSYL